MIINPRTLIGLLTLILFNSQILYGFPQDDSNKTKVVKSKKYNYLIEIPVSLSYDENQKEAEAFNATRANPYLEVMVFTDLRGIESEINAKDLAQHIINEFKKTFKKEQKAKLKEKTINGLKGFEFSLEGDLTGTPMILHYWVCCHNGFHYRVIVQGESKRIKELEKEKEKILSTFKPLDPKKIQHIDKERLFGLYKSKHFGFEIDLRKTQWIKKEKASRKMNGEIHGIYSDQYFFIFTPLYVGDLGAASENIQKALLQWHQRAYVIERKILKTGTLNEMKWNIRELVHFINDRQLKTRYTIFLGKDVAYLASFHAFPSPNGNFEGFEEAADSFFKAIKVPQGGKYNINRSQLTPSELHFQSMMVNVLGVFAFQRGEFQQAIKFFDVAIRHQPHNAQYVINKMFTHNRLGQHEEAAKFFDQPNLPDWKNNELDSWKAFHFYRSFRHDEASKVYESLFKRGYRNDGAFHAYLSILTFNKEWKTAYKALKAYSNKNNTEMIQTLWADTKFTEGKKEEAHQRLDAQLKKNFSIDVALMKLGFYQRDNDYKSAHKKVQEFIKAKPRLPMLYREKADIERSLKRIPDAIQSIKKAIELDPKNEGYKAFLKHLEERKKSQESEEESS